MCHYYGLKNNILSGQRLGDCLTANSSNRQIKVYQTLIKLTNN